MAGNVAERAAKPGKGGRRPKRRVSILLDMTPMVDIAFLLLIFYMVSTVFAMPQAMEINLPPADEQDDEIEVKESNLLTIRIDDESRYWWNLKRTSPDNLPQLISPVEGSVGGSVESNIEGSLEGSLEGDKYQVSSDSLRNLLVEHNRENPKLSTLVLIHKDATYADMVNMLDEIDLIERSWNAAIAKQLGKKVKKLTKADGKFSYRYAIGEWEDRDDRIIAAALENAIAQGAFDEQ